MMTPQEIESLVDARRPEGPRLEYKRELPGPTDTDKLEFLADVVAMANAGGGYILFGIADEDGAAAEITGVTASEELIQRLGNFVRDGVEPRLPRVAITTVRVCDKDILELSIPLSYARPHWVSFKSKNRFYMRHNADKVPMSIDEVRSSFLQAGEAVERAVAWRRARAEELLHIPTQRHVTVAMHLVPLIHATLESARLTPSFETMRLLRTLLSETSNFRPNYLGSFSASPLENDAYYDYVQVYRDLRVEAVFEGGVNLDGRKGLWASQMEGKINAWLEAARPWFATVNYPLPTAVFLSIIAVQPTVLMEGLRPATSSELVLLFEPTVINNPDFDAAGIMRPAYDHIWQSYGSQSCPNYNDEGEYVSKV
jgi:hypothetical protein